MSKDKIVQNLQISEECKRCGRYNKSPHNCCGRVVNNTPCMAFIEVKND